MLTVNWFTFCSLIFFTDFVKKSVTLFGNTEILNISKTGVRNGKNTVRKKNNRKHSENGKFTQSNYNLVYQLEKQKTQGVIETRSHSLYDLSSNFQAKD